MAGPSPVQGRSYDDALQLLSQLPSNKSAADLFSAGTRQEEEGKGKGKDVNALALPEMQAWLLRAGLEPSALTTGLRCVHVAGTKGKGSVAAMVASVLRQYPALTGGGVGLYTSPHLTSVRERIVLDGAPVSRHVFARHFFDLWDRLSAADLADSKPFYFRFLTLLALRLFLGREGRAAANDADDDDERRPRSVVVECGIGGAYDATNALPTGCVTTSVVTQLGLDHVAMLGDTVDKIAWHKAGVFRPGRTAVTRRLDGRGDGDDDDDDAAVMAVLRARAAELGLRELIEVTDADVAAWQGVAGARMRGPFVKSNMALAATAAREHMLALGARLDGPFGEPGWRLDDMPEAFVTGLREAFVRGRCETFDGPDGTTWFLDGAHTEDSLVGVGAWFTHLAGARDHVRVLVFNQQDRDRHPEKLLGALLAACAKTKVRDETETETETETGTETYRAFHHAFFTRNELETPDDGVASGDYLSKQSQAADTMKRFDPTTDVRVEAAVSPSVHHVARLNREAKREGKKCKVLVTGSFHLVGTVLGVIDHVEE